MKDGMDFPLRGDAEMESCVEDNFFDLKGACSFHLELLRPIHVKICHFQPDLFSYFPGDEFRGNLLLYLLLGYLVGSLSIISCSR